MSTLRLPPSPAEVEELERLQRSTRYLDAFHLAQNFAAPEEWSDTHAIVVAGRLHNNWGDWARSNRLHRQAWRAAPRNLDALYFSSLTVESKHGPFEALRFLREHQALLESDSPTREHVWLWLNQARLLGVFRDFDPANDLVRRAESIVGDDPWFWVERARLRQQQDRYEEALADAQRALELAPSYRPSVETMAELLMLRNRDQEALALLQRSLGELQSGSLAQSLALLHTEMDQHAEALVAIDRAEACLPCANDTNRRWLASRRADALRALGRDAEAAAQAKLAKQGFHDHIAARLSEPAPAGAKRVHLRVTFVRQHHMTCAPATLAALGDYWRRPVDHLELARTICYDGTPDHEERHWAEASGWIVREFRVTWPIAVALLERGCPFTLTTVATRSAHLQAVVGFDSRLGLLLIRDPYLRSHSECIGEPFLAGCASHGPRGMVLLPPDRAALLEGLELPDAALYDGWYRLRRALLRHDRAAAQAEAEALEAAAPGQRLSLIAQRELAFYDGNNLRQLETTRALRKLFPEDSNFRLDEAQMLRALGHRSEWRERVAALAAHRPVEPIFLREYVEMLGDDARGHPRAFREARRVLRRFAVEPGNLRAFANVLWNRQEFEAATHVYRLAACVGEKTESHWTTYFSASRHTRQVDQCLLLLRQREARLGPQSSQPVCTLFRALDTLDRTGEAFEALQAALLRRPDDGELQLFAAEQHGRYGRFAEAARWLEAATSRAPRTPWLRTAARVTEFRMDFAAALGHWRELLQFNPIDSGAHHAAAGLISTLEGRPAALAFLRAACAAHPNQLPLHNTLLEWLRSEPPEEALRVADHLLALDPANAWALREKAQLLCRQQRGPDALLAAEEACRIEPTSAYSRAVRGTALSHLGREAEARAAFTEALQLSIDCGYIDALLDASPDYAQRQSAIAFVRAELARQPVFDGGTFLRFRELARTVLAPEELRGALEALLPAHDTSWGIRSALIAHLLDERQIEAALTRAREAVERFPLVPRLWLDLAIVQSHAKQADAEIESLNRALELSPAWGHASRLLSQAYERLLRLDDAEHALRRAIAADPVDAVSHAWLAELLWRRGKHDEALTLVERAIVLSPGFDWAWQKLDEWTFERHENARLVAIAEGLTKARPADPRAWIRLGRTQSRDPAQALAAADKALAIDPREIDAHDLRVQLLVKLERFDEALASCRPAIFGGHPPVPLLGRAAWIEHARGNVTRAIADLRRALEAHPDYRWGWGCLTEWLWDTRDYAGALEAAKKWTWLAPDYAIAFGFLAAVELQLGHRREAKDAFWRALHSDPTYGYGAQRLLQLLADDRELEEARRLLRHIETHLSAAEAQHAAVRFHIMARDRDAAAKALATLATVSPAEVHLLEQAATALHEAGWRSVVEDSLEPLLPDPKTNPVAGRLWVAAWSKAASWRRLYRLGKLSAPEPLRHLAWAEALEQLGTARATWRLRWYRWRRGAWLRQNSQAWGSFGYALITADMPGAVVRWMHDWRERSDAQPWMLHNLALACFQRNRADDAVPVLDHALTLPATPLRARFVGWRGLESALRGDTAAAKAALERLAEPTSDFAKFERRLLEILVEFETALASPASARDALTSAKRQITDLWINSPAAHKDPSLIQFYRRALRQVGRRGGSTWTVICSYLLTLTFTHRVNFSQADAWVWIVIAVVLINLMRACVRA